MIKIIYMINDFQLLCEEMKTIGNFEAYKRYTMKYPDLFEGIFKGLYMTDINNLRSMINRVDFFKNLKIAQENEKHGICEQIIKEVEKVASLLKFTEDFDLYLGLELGNIGGVSFPNTKDNPFIYIGLDRAINESFIKYTVPHEMNHMVRINAIREIKLSDFTERVITEGLGSFCPIALYGMEYSTQVISNVLNLSIEEVKRLMLNKVSLIDKLTGEFGMSLTKDKMKAYFTWSIEDKQPHLSGYYVGMEIVKQLVNAGYDFAQLTIMPSQLILREYNTINQIK